MDSSAVAVHHALEQRAFIQIAGDGHHVLRMLIRKGVIRRLDALLVVTVDNAQTLGRHFIQRHIAPDNAVVAAEDVPVAHHHRHAVGIGFQRHVAKLLRRAEAVVADVHAPDASGKHIVNLAACLVIADGARRVIAVPRHLVQLGDFLGLRVVNQQSRFNRVYVVVAADHQQLALGIGADAVYLVIRIQRHGIDHFAIQIERKQLQQIAVGERVAQVDDIALRQLAVVRNDDFHQLGKSPVGQNSGVGKKGEMLENCHQRQQRSKT